MFDKDFTLQRILRGRLAFKRGDLSLYIIEPTQELMYESIEVYDEAYNQARDRGVLTQENIDNFLIEHNLWNPLDEKIIENMKDEIENLKVEAYKNYFKTKELKKIKYGIYSIEKKIIELSFEKNRWVTISCEGIASAARSSWVIENCVYYKDGMKYDWKHIGLNYLSQYYENNSISSSEFRLIARTEPWRSIWNIGKKQGNIFSRPATELTKDQVMLSSYTSMYDNVYEHPETPPDGVISDDDCLDGWFIDQRRKNELAKKQNAINDTISNSKIANSSEIFVMASDAKDIQAINSMNSPQARGVKREREAAIRNGVTTDLNFPDVQRKLRMEADQAMIKKARGN